MGKRNSERDARVIQLRLVDELSYQEISERIGISITRARHILAEYRAELREQQHDQ